MDPRLVLPILAVVGLFAGVAISGSSHAESGAARLHRALVSTCIMGAVTWSTFMQGFGGLGREPDLYGMSCLYVAALGLGMTCGGIIGSLVVGLGAAFGAEKREP